MNAPRTSRRIGVSAVVQVLLFCWLLGFSVAVVLGYRTVNQLAEQVQTSVESQQVLALETRVAELAASIQPLEAKPEPATATALQDVQQTLRIRIAQIEQGLTTFATVDDVQVLRGEIEQVKVRQAAVRAVSPPASRRPPLKPTVVAPQPEPFPYRVVGVELRAGLRSVLVAPITDAFRADQIQVLLPGDALGSWHLQAIDGNTAVFLSGEQIRRMAIPGGSE